MYGSIHLFDLRFLIECYTMALANKIKCNLKNNVGVILLCFLLLKLSLC